MTRLAARAEIEKLGRLLDLPSSAVMDEIFALPALQVREMRRAISERLFHLDEIIFKRLAVFANLLPTRVLLWLAQSRFGPLITARVAGLMVARRAARTAERMPPEFLADVSQALDPRYTRDILVRISSQQIIAVAQVLVARGDHMTMGRFVDYLADDTIRAVLAAIPDEEQLIRIAYYMESKNRIDHVVRMMPRERLRRAILLVLEPERDLMLPLMSLVFHVSYALQQELGELAAEQDESVLNEIVRATQQYQLWGDLLPVVAQLSRETQQKIVNLPILRDDSEVVESILQAAEQEGLWRAVLPLIPLMDEPIRVTVAGLAAKLSATAIRGIAEAALMGEMWEEVAELVSRTPAAKQEEIVQVLLDFAGGVDADLEERLQNLADRHGFGDPYRQYRHEARP